jgi:hypothetical protein
LALAVAAIPLREEIDTAVAINEMRIAAANKHTLGTLERVL